MGVSIKKCSVKFLAPIEKFYSAKALLKIAKAGKNIGLIIYTVCNVTFVINNFLSTELDLVYNFV